MKKFIAIMERCPETKLFVGYIPELPGAHSPGRTLRELKRNLREVVEMLREDQLEMTEEFKAKIELAEQEMKEGKRPRLRRTGAAGYAHLT